MATTTDTYRKVFGKRVKRVEHVWRIEGKHGKGECVRPFLTSAKACREYIRSEIDLSERVASDEMRAEIAIGDSP
jgi:hypothetical protein